MPRGIYQRVKHIPTVKELLDKRELKLMDQLNTFLIDVSEAVDSKHITESEEAQIIARIKMIIDL